MRDELTVRIAGEAGQGMQTIGLALSKLYRDAGYNIFANQDYMSRIRGGNNFFQLRIAGNSPQAFREKADIIVALDKQSVALHKEACADGGIVILDKKAFKIDDNNTAYFDVPLHAMAHTAGAGDLFINTVSFGLIAGLTGIAFSYVEKIVRDTFSDKIGEVVGKNVEAAQSGHSFAERGSLAEKFTLKKAASSGALVMNGNEAIALGAISAGCKFYSAYPMTPSTSIMNIIARYADRFNIVLEQAEDEIAAINMVVGASFAGVRAMTGTSGGGFALMTEGVSLAGVTETPIVIAEVQRPAPATGLPTRTEQADLDFLLSAGHGEFARVIFTPGSIEECFYLTKKAFNIAEKYQIPVFIVSDQYLADTYRNIKPFDLKRVSVERHLIDRTASKKIKSYKRYRITQSGISPRAVPSWIDDVIYVDSDEHTEEGHITERGDVRKVMVEKRLYKKNAGLLKEIEKPCAQRVKGADSVCIGFGSTCGVLKEAAASIKRRQIGVIHLPQVWPFPADEMKILLKGARKIITVENNAAGQLAKLLLRESGIKRDDSILKYDGRAFDVDCMRRSIEERAG